MAAIQSLLDSCTNIMIDKSRPTAISMSRGQRLKTQSRGPSIYRFTVGMNPALPYEINRGLLEDYDALGRDTEEEVTLSTVSGGSWIMGYQGQVLLAEQSLITITAASDANITVNASGVSTGSGTILFEKGDYLQPIGSRYSYQVTEQVLRGGGTAVVPVNRGIFESGATLVGKGLNFGTDCTFRVKMVNQPSYRVVPGRYIGWSGDMILSEVIDE